MEEKEKKEDRKRAIDQKERNLTRLSLQVKQSIKLSLEAEKGSV
jgi:hypothetical protein